MALKDTWKKVGRDFKDLGNTNVKDVGSGIAKIAGDFSKAMVRTAGYSAQKVSDKISEYEEEKDKNEAEANAAFTDGTDENR